MTPSLLKALTLETIDRRYDGWLKVFTDGSAEESIRNAGCGVFVEFPDGRPHIEKSAAVGQKANNYMAEVGAMQVAVEILQDIVDLNRFAGIVILSDSKAAIQAMLMIHKCQDMQVHSVSGALNSLARDRGVTVCIQWVPGHCGVMGNVRADRLARIGRNHQQPVTAMTLEAVRSCTKSIKHARLLASTPGINVHDPYYKLGRAEQVYIMRLRTGHCRLAAHGCKIGIVDSSVCLCGEADETVRHFLASCTLHSILRQNIWPSGIDMEAALFGGIEDLRLTAQFARMSGRTI
jgi:ribonuclease HI